MLHNISDVSYKLRPQRGVSYIIADKKKKKPNFNTSVSKKIAFLKTWLVYGRSAADTEIAWYSTFEHFPLLRPNAKQTA
jgi:hypothetical protein